MSTTKKNVTTNKLYNNDVAINEIYELAKKLDSNVTLLTKQSTDEKYITLYADNGVKARAQVWFCARKIDIYVGNNVINQSLANVANIAVIDNVGKAKHSKNEIVLSYSSFDNVKAFFESVISDMNKDVEKTAKQSKTTVKQSKKRASKNASKKRVVV